MHKDSEMTPAAALSVRDRAMDAAALCFQELGLNKTSMESVAKRGQMSRATLYRHFSNRDELAITVIEREALQVARRVNLRIEALHNIDDFIVEGIVEACDEIAASAILSSLFKPDSIATSGKLLFMTNRLTNIGIDIIRPMIEPAQKAGVIRDDIGPDMIMDWIFRLLVSLLTIPSEATNTADKKRELLREMLLPALLV